MDTRASDCTGSPLRNALEVHRVSDIQISLSNSNMEDGPQSAPALFVPLAPPIHRSVDPQKVSKFLKERERYELQVLARRAEQPTLKVETLLASTDRTMLGNLITLGELDEISPKKTLKTLTEEELEEYIQSLVQHPKREIRSRCYRARARWAKNAR